MNEVTDRRLEGLEDGLRDLKDRVYDLENGQIPAVRAQTWDEAPEPTMYERLEELRRERDSLSSQLSDVLRKSKDLSSKNKDLSSDLYNARRNLSGQIKELRTDNIRLAREVDRLRGVVVTDSVRQDQVRQINDLVQERADLKGQLRQSSDEIARLRRTESELRRLWTKEREVVMKIRPVYRDAEDDE